MVVGGGVVVHVEACHAAGVGAHVAVHVVPVAVQLDQVPGVVAVEIVDDLALDAEHLHEQTEGRGVADTDRVAVFEHAVGIVRAVVGVRNHRQQAGVGGELRREPGIDGLFLLVVAHVVGDDGVENVLCHLERLLVAVGQGGGVAGEVGVGDLGRGADRVFVHDHDVVLGFLEVLAAFVRLLQSGFQRGLHGLVLAHGGLEQLVRVSGLQDRRGDAGEHAEHQQNGEHAVDDGALFRGFFRGGGFSRGDCGFKFGHIRYPSFLWEACALPFASVRRIRGGFVPKKTGRTGRFF